LPTGPKKLGFPSAGALATTGVSSTVQALHALSVRMKIKVTSMAAHMTLVKRNRHGRRPRAAPHATQHGRPAGPALPRGDEREQCDRRRSAASTITAGTTVWIRDDIDALTRLIRFYQPADGSTWTEIGTARTGTASNLFDSTTPLVFGTFAGEAERFQLLSLDGATTTIDEDFTPSLGAGWSLAGGAVLVDA
jgi:hypothetical protein